jgi:uncharacterized protein YegL
MNKKITPISILLTFVLLFANCYMTKKSTSYYGIDNTTSKKIVFLIDISGSMEGKAESNLQGQVVSKAVNNVGNNVGNKVGGVVGNVIKNQTNNQLTKLGKAKKELIPTIKGLSEDTYFTVIVFENTIKAWNPGLVQATSANKSIAVMYINNLSSGGGTNAYDALEKAFQLAGEGAKDNTKPLGVETMYFLSDGEPNEGKVTDPEQLVNKVKEWNPNKKVVIHSIGLGEDKDVKFLTNLATSNNGKYIDK